MSKIYLDTESPGLHSIPVLLQYAVEDGPVEIYNIWENKAGDVIELLEYLADNELIFFNAAHDWFMLYKLYTMLVTLNDSEAYLDTHIQELAELEMRARDCEFCLKPRSAHDVMLHARKTHLQSLMDRDDIVIRRIPTALAFKLAEELERRVTFDNIYFAKRKDHSAPKWKVFDITDSSGNVNPDFKNIKLKFRASGALKNLYRHAFKVPADDPTFFTYKDIEIDPKYYPDELGYAPFAAACAPNAPNDWGWTWPAVIQHHLRHWYYNQNARTYAGNDVIYTRRLYKEFFKSPPVGDTDSILACMVGAVRWRGYKVRIERTPPLENGAFPLNPSLKDLKWNAMMRLKIDPDVINFYIDRPVTQKIVNKFSKAVIAPRVAMKYLKEVMAPEEQLALQGSTKAALLESIVNSPDKWSNDDGTPHPARIRAKEILDARKAKKELELYDKLIRAGRFHASFKIIGALSSRMSGDSGFNPQGIKHQTYVRSAFDLADPDKDEILCGGDFKSFEVSIAAKVFDDPKLNQALQSGKKMHALFGMELFPGQTYEQICKSEGTDNDMYDKGKKGVFAFFYGGEAHTLVTRLSVPIEVAEQAIQGIGNRFPGVRRFGDKVRMDFGALTQPRGIGTKVEWHDPKDYAETILGFKRYFTLENRVMRCLFELAQNVPAAWREIKVKVVRRDRMQTASGATSSALYGAAFGIMSRTIRAAKNHYIQSPGAEITKATQAAIWEVQPIGASPWIVAPMQIHDEIMVPVKKGYEQIVESKVKETVAQFKKIIPLLAIDWFNDIPNWAGKKG